DLATGRERRVAPRGVGYGQAVEVGDVLTAQPESGVAVANTHDGGPAHAVVVAGHRVRVGAGRRERHEVAGPKIRGEHEVSEDVTRLAVLADDPEGLRFICGP